jgi:starch synthase
MRVLFATAEFAPVAFVGGLAAASAGLVHELRDQGVDILLALPDYSDLPLVDEETFGLDVPSWVGGATARSGILEGVGEVVLISVPGIARAHPYLDTSGQGWPDNDRRFFAFSAAVASLYRRSGADVLHLNDWHTATALAHFGELPPSVFTIHSLGYQGDADAGWLETLPHHADAFERFHSCNPVAGAVRLADAIVAVSPSYADEICRPNGGFGLHDILRDRGDALVGIINGIDTSVWDPAIDPALAAPFDAADTSGKDACRAALCEEMGLADTPGPVVAMVTRLTGQKGIDLALDCMPYLAGLRARLIVLGSGDAELAASLGHAAAEQPTRVAFRTGYDEDLSHRIFAGADLFLMPSRFEPCGLAQMQAMRYGTLPVVTGVGGLLDTVVDLDATPATGTGFVARDVSSLAVLDALHRAVRGWGNRPRRDAARRRAMTADWSWSASAQRYVDIYRGLLAR